MLIKKIVIRSNGDAYLYSEDGTTTVVKLLDQLISKLLALKQIDEQTEINIPLSPEPIKVKDWYNIKPVE